MSIFDQMPTSHMAHRTTILIDKPDWEYIRKNRLKPTNLLRKKISELRELKDGTNWEAAAEKIRANMQKILTALEANVPKEKFTQILQEAHK